MDADQKFGAHYGRCKRCKPGVTLHQVILAPKVLCPVGLKLYRKANNKTSERRNDA
jgi:hypothetical protein